jgi:hypothetical protein
MAEAINAITVGDGAAWTPAPTFCLVWGRYSLALRRRQHTGRAFLAFTAAWFIEDVAQLGACSTERGIRRSDDCCRHTWFEVERYTSPTLRHEAEALDR